jgi:hypothetical protein
MLRLSFNSSFPSPSATNPLCKQRLQAPNEGNLTLTREICATLRPSAHIKPLVDVV